MFALRRRSSRDTRFCLPLAPLMGIAALCLASSARADTYIVNRAVDDGSGTVSGTFTWAINQANAHQNVLSDPNDPNSSRVPDTIDIRTDVTLPVTLYQIPNSNPVVYRPMPYISESVNIVGNGATISRDATATDDYRIITMANANVTISDLTIANGSAAISTDAAKQFPFDFVNGAGGGIYSLNGTLTLNGCRVLQCKATATAPTNPLILPNRLTGNGGGVYKDGGTFTVNSTSVAACTSVGATNAAGLFGGRGGGIYNRGTMTLGRIGGNPISIVGDLPLPDNVPPFAGNVAVIGGGVYNTGTLTIQNNSIVRTNTVTMAAGGVYNSGTLTVNTSTIRGNSVSAGAGGGIYNFVASPVTMTDSVVSFNTATGEGAGIESVGTNMELNRCTLAANTSSGGLGGGISNVPFPPFVPTGSINLLQCTFGDNAAGTNQGGSLYNNGGLVLVYHNTIVSRTGTGILNTGGGDMTVTHTILAATGGNLSNINGAALTSLGYNLSNDNTGPNDGQTDRFNTDPQLKILQQRSGATPTYVPRKGSPVIDAGDPALFSTTDFTEIVRLQAGDQRQLNRFVGDSIDIGSVERQADVDGQTTENIFDAPPNPFTGANDNYRTNENGLLVVAAPGVLGNDGVVNGVDQKQGYLPGDSTNPLTAVLVTTTQNGKLTLNPDGSFTYIPNPAINGVAPFIGTDTFTYRSRDRYAEFNNRNGSDNFITVKITVQPVNQPPDIQAVPDVLVLVNTPISFNASFFDYDVTAPATNLTRFNGFTILPPTNAPGDPALPVTFTASGLTPDPNTSNKAAFTVTAPGISTPGTYRVLLQVKDPGNLIGKRIVTIRVTQPNNPPILNAIPDQTVRVNQLFRLQVTATDPDLPPTGTDVLTYSLDATSIARGITIDSARGVISWTPRTPGGPFPVTVTVTDRAGAARSRTFNITVTADPTASALIVVTGATVTRQTTSIVTVTAALKNNGNGTATNVKFTSAQLGTLNASLISPATTVNGGAQGTLTIAFNGSGTAIKRGPAVFQYTGSYVSQGKTVVLSGKITINVP